MMQYALCLWPGLPELWNAGRWRGLAWAVAFSAGLNLWVIATFVWTEWIPRVAYGSLGLLLAAGWSISVVYNALWQLAQRRRQARQAAEGRGDSGDLFPRALNEYLTGNWYETQRICRAILTAESADAEALLLLSTVLRRTKQFQEAEACLAELQRLDAAGRWAPEIAEECRRLAAQKVSWSSSEVVSHPETQVADIVEEVASGDGQAGGMKRQAA